MHFYKDEILRQIKSGSEELRIYGDIYDSDAEEMSNALKEARESASENNAIPNLEKISFDRSKISDYGLKLIMGELSLFPRLKTLSFDFCFIQAEGAKYIANLLRSSKSMVSFTFQRNCPTKECWLELAQYAGISKNECNSWIEIFAPVIAVNETIKYADLSSGAVDDNAAELLAAALTSNDTLERLDISYLRISSENMEKICRAVDVNKTLKSIRAQFCGDPRPHFGEAGIEIYQFHQIASETFKNKEKCKVFDEWDYFDRLTSRKRSRASYRLD